MMVAGGITADYGQVKRITETMAQLLTKADEIRLRRLPKGPISLCVLKAASRSRNRAS